MLNKLHLVYDNVTDINSNIQVAKGDKSLRLNLRNSLDTRIYYQFQEILKGVYLTVDENNNRGLIDNSGNIVKCWNYINSDIDLYHIGKYLDSLDANYLKNSIHNCNNLINIKIGKAEREYKDTLIVLKEKIRYTHQFSILYINDYKNNIEIQSLIDKNGIREIKFIDGDIGSNNVRFLLGIRELNDYTRYLRKHSLGNLTDDISGIYDNKNNLIFKCTPYDLMKAIRIKNGIVLTINNTNRYRIIHKGKLKYTECEYLGESLGIIQFKDIKTDKIVIYKRE